MKYDLEKMRKKVKKNLDKPRYQHTLGVMYTAASLAMCYGEDLERTMVAGLLHDCAKCIPNSEKIDLCKHYNLPISDIERENPSLLHSKLGAQLARDKYGVKDPGILNSINYHTTGKPAMSLLEKIIFLADFIEPGRYKSPDLEEIRKMSFSNIDKAVYMTLASTLDYLKRQNTPIDQQTEVAYNYYKRITQDEDE